MISRYAYKKLTWIDLESPTKEEVISIAQEYKLPSLVAEELYQQTLRSKVDRYDDLIYLILHFPVIVKGKSIEREIDFVVGKNFLITTHYQSVDPLHEFSKIFETNSILHKEEMGNNGGFLFFYIMRELYKHTTAELDEINKSFTGVEKRIFEGKEGEMVEVISQVNRKIVDFKQAVRFHSEILKSYEIASKEFFGEDYAYYASSIIGEHTKIQNILEGHKDIMRELRETNDSLLSNKTNEAMRTLTVMNFVMLPLALITGIFGMNANFVFIHDLGDFSIVVAIMIAIGAIMLLYFKKKKWI